MVVVMVMVVVDVGIVVWERVVMMVMAAVVIEATTAAAAVMAHHVAVAAVTECVDMAGEGVGVMAAAVIVIHSEDGSERVEKSGGGETSDGRMETASW